MRTINLRGIWMKTCNPEETGTQQLIFPAKRRPSNFEEGIELGRDQERQRLAAYFHDQLAPDLMALAFSIEAIRMELENEKHPAEAKLKDVRDRLSKMLQPIRENILNGSANSFLRKAILCLKGKDCRPKRSDRTPAKG
jgi:hypothetical protein